MEINLLHDKDLEAEVLGGIMFDAVTFDKLPAKWDEAIFYKPEHKTIAWAIGQLKLDKKPTDTFSVISQLKSNNKLDAAGGAFYLNHIQNNALGHVHTIYHFQIIYEKYLLRKLVEFGHELVISTGEFDADPFKISEKFEKKISELSSGIVNLDFKTIGDLNKKGIQKIKDIKSGKRLSGVYIGFEELQNHTGGWQRGELIILAARPAMGKTALAIQFLLKPAFNKIPTAFFSLEMGDEPITSRVQSIVSGYSATNIIRAKALTDADIRSIELSTNCLNNLNFYIDDTPAISLYNFRNKARKCVTEMGVQLIIIDYLQLMTAFVKGGNREQEISTISRTLKETAKELNVPIIALSQLSRDVEKRTGNKRPQLSDLRESGAIEQDADMVLFIHRPEYFGLDVFDDGTDAINKAEIIIAKNRNGSIGTTILGFEKNNVRFHDINEENSLKPNTEFTKGEF